MINHAHHRGVKLVPIGPISFCCQTRGTKAADVHVRASPFCKVDGLRQASDHFVIADMVEVLVTKCAAKLEQVRPSQPAHFLIKVVVFAVPYSAARVLGVDVHGHQAVDVALGIDLHRST